jgi:hypothetical protein
VQLVAKALVMLAHGAGLELAREKELELVLYKLWRLL